MTPAAAGGPPRPLELPPTAVAAFSNCRVFAIAHALTHAERATTDGVGPVRLST